MPALPLGLTMLLAGASLAQTLPEPVVIAENAIQPQVAVDAAGNVHAVFIQGGNISVAISNDQGKTFGRPAIAMDLKGNARGGAQRGPRIGVDAKGRITVTAPVTLDAAEYSKKYPTAELYLVASGDGGKSWTSPLQVNEASKKAPEALHWMAVAPTGEALVAWLDLRGRLVPGQDLYLARVTNGAVSKNEKIATTVCECCAPGLALVARAAGVQPIIAWREGGSEPISRNLLVQGLRSDDGADGRERLNGADTHIATCPMSAPAVASTRDGARCVVAWMDERAGQGKRQVFYKLFDAGLPSGDAPIDASRGARQDHPAAAFDSAGEAWIAYEEGPRRESRVYARPLAKGSKPLAVSSEADGPAAFPCLAAGGKVLGIAYEAGPEKGQRVVFRRLQ